jgi:hypothetical protein
VANAECLELPRRGDTELRAEQSENVFAVDHTLQCASTKGERNRSRSAATIRSHPGRKWL